MRKEVAVTTENWNWRAQFCWLGLVSTLAFLSPVRWASGEEFWPDSLREEAELLTRRAEELKATGRIEEAEKALRRAEELRIAANRREKDVGAEGAREPRDPREGLKRELVELRTRLKELDEAGQNEEATELRRRIQRLEEQLNRLGMQRPLEEERRPQQVPPAPWGHEEWPRPDVGTEPERRLDLLRQAVGCLRAAGMHEVADRVMDEIARVEFDLRRRVERRSEPPLPPAGDVEQLRAEILELKRTMREMQERLDLLTKERH